VYENAETGVRIRPFQLYGMVRNPQNRWSNYERYFRHVQDEWAATDDTDKSAMITAIKTRIEATGASVFSGYPYVNKLVELRLIGRQHPGMSATIISTTP
jgi:hypothetical protein